jgi:hypothetical protein
VSETDLTTVGDRCGTMSVGRLSKYDDAEGMDIWIGGVGMEMSLLRHLKAVQSASIIQDMK